MKTSIRTYFWMRTTAPRKWTLKEEVHIRAHPHGSKTFQILMMITIISCAPRRREDKQKVEVVVLHSVAKAHALRSRLSEASGDKEVSCDSNALAGNITRHTKYQEMKRFESIRIIQGNWFELWSELTQNKMNLIRFENDSNSMIRMMIRIDLKWFEGWYESKDDSILAQWFESWFELISIKMILIMIRKHTTKLNNAQHF